MSAYNPISIDDIEHIAAQGGWESARRPTSDEAPVIVLHRTEEHHGPVEIEVHFRGQTADEVEITHWKCSQAPGYEPGDWYDSRDDESDHGTAEAWQPTVALGSLVSRLLLPAQPVQ